MKNFKLKKLVALMTVTLMTVVAISPIKASAAWKQDSNGWWNTEGSSWSTGWRAIDNTWYYFGSDGYMKTGWFLDGGKWYYAASSGAMQTGWLFNNNLWYYLSTSGDMKTGLTEINNKTYYLDESGAMKTGNVAVNGTNYTFATSGEKVNTTDSKIAATTDTTKSNATTTTTDSTKSTTTSSGGSGGSSSSSNTSSSTTSDSKSSSKYESLYGTWKVGSFIAPSSTTVDKTKYVDSEFTISKNGITYGSFTGTPKVKESSMTTSAFNQKWGTNLHGTNVNCVSISYLTKSVTVYITDDNTYATFGGLLYELDKQ